MSDILFTPGHIWDLSEWGVRLFKDSLFSVLAFAFQSRRSFSVFACLTVKASVFQLCLCLELGEHGLLDLIDCHDCFESSCFDFGISFHCRWDFHISATRSTALFARSSGLLEFFLEWLVCAGDLDYYFRLK